MPNRFRVQDIDPVLFDHQIIDIKQYNAWEDQHLTPEQKNEIAKLIYERFKDDTDIATQNYFFVVERTSEGVDALAGAIGARAARSRNTQPPIKPQGISKGSNIKGIKVNWGQATTFINDRFEALQKSVGQLPKNKLAYDGPDVNYKSSTQKPLEPTRNQIEVRKYYSGTEPENSASGSASGKNKNSSGNGTEKGEVESIPPNKLVGIEHEKILNPRDSLDKKVPIRGGVKGNPKSRNLNGDEKAIAHQVLDDIAAQARGDKSATERLLQRGDHVLENRSNGQNYAGWNSVYIKKLDDENNGVMRIIYKQTAEGIKWNVVQWH